MEKKEVLVVDCVDCGVTFDISVEEQNWYEERGYQMPKRCNKCRKAKRNKNKNNNKGRK